MTTLNGQTPDIARENIAALRALFPEICCEDKVDFDKLKQVLGDYVDDSKERYNFTWNGKGRALRLAQTPSMGTLRPCKEESKNWDDTENLYLEGDNLEVLKLLQKSYHGKIKMIYIDPPYNTGGDFVYPDDFSDNIENYKKITGQVDSDGKRLGTNAETSGRYHTDWLNMMYPRLRLARNILAENGAIFVHMDEHEIYNLQKLCAEVFGEANELGTIIWDKRNPKGATGGVSYQHESILVYAKSKTIFVECPFAKEKENAANMLAKATQLIKNNGEVNENVRNEYKAWIKLHGQELSGGEKAYNSIDNRGRIYRSVSMAAPDKPETRSHRPLIHPLTHKPCPTPAKGWRFTDETMDKLLLAEKIEFGIDETTQPNQRYYLEENLEEAFSSLFYYGGSDDAMGLPFDNPKPVYTVTRIIKSICKNKTDIVLDFFSGSATTAHAVMQLNAEDGGNRKFICVQLPEPCAEGTEAAKAGYSNICEIGKERIRRAGEKIKAEVEEQNAQIKLGEEPKRVPDIGFKVFKLDSSNLKKWQPREDDLEQSLFDSVGNYVEGRSEKDVVYEIMLKMGLSLTCPLEEHDVGGKKVYAIGMGALMICMDDDITPEVADGMVALHAELTPVVWKVVFRDNGFATDSAKVNCKEILKCAGLEEAAFTTV